MYTKVAILNKCSNNNMKMLENAYTGDAILVDGFPSIRKCESRDLTTCFNHVFYCVGSGDYYELNRKCLKTITNVKCT